MTILWSYGFNDVRRMKGDFGAWTEVALPLAEAEDVN